MDAGDTWSRGPGQHSFPLQTSAVTVGPCMRQTQQEGPNADSAFRGALAQAEATFGSIHTKTFKNNDNKGNVFWG